MAKTEPISGTGSKQYEMEFSPDDRETKKAQNSYESPGVQRHPLSTPHLQLLGYHSSPHWSRPQAGQVVQVSGDKVL
jgi:hypothetical protein